jgi:polyhydroxybutyrate depolymerase
MNPLGARLAIALLWTALMAGPIMQPAAMASSKTDNEGGYHPAVPTDIYSRLPFEGEDRKYLVHLPPNYEPDVKMPLVVVLHGGGGDIGFAVRMFQFNAKADKEGFIVAYPNGSGRFHDHILTWNADACCGYAKAHHKDDVGFVREFLQKVVSQYSIDTSRVYLVGFSNGAMMAYRLACAMPERFAAFASVSGSMNGKERAPGLPIAGMIIHGSADRHIPVRGGGGKLKKWGFDVHAMPLEYAVQFWRKADGCSTVVAGAENHGQVHYRKFINGKDGADVEVYVIDGYRHSWPGGHRAWFRADPPYPDLSATDLCWSFFSKHTRDLSGAKICNELDQLSHVLQP